MEILLMGLRSKVASVLILLSLSCSWARGDVRDESGLVKALKEHYKLATSKLGTNGELQFEPGSILTVRKEGIMSFAEKDASFAELCPSVVHGGSVRPSHQAACTNLSPKSKRLLKISE